VLRAFMLGEGTVSASSIFLKPPQYIPRRPRSGRLSNFCIDGIEWVLGNGRESGSVVQDWRRIWTFDGNGCTGTWSRNRGR